MKVLLLADVNSPHTQKWARGLIHSGVQVSIYSLQKASENYFSDLKNLPVLLHTENMSNEKSRPFAKLSYLRALPHINKWIREWKPDILHAHYATSYGLLGALAGFQPFCISVWGDDVFYFPYKSVLLAKGLKLILSRAKVVFSTSKVMKSQTKKFYKGPIQVIPFGISMEKFSGLRTNRDGVMRFTVVKSLDERYNVHLVVQAFVAMANENNLMEAELHIAGDGHLREKLNNLAGKWKDVKIFFHGNIPNLQVPEFLVSKDVLFNISDFESFGVSVIEASASGLAVVTSDRGGLIEVVKDQETGIVLTLLTEQTVREVMSRFLKNPHLAEIMGKAGRDFVRENFDFNHNVRQQIAAYKSMLN